MHNSNIFNISNVQKKVQIKYKKTSKNQFGMFPSYTSCLCPLKNENNLSC